MAQTCLRYGEWIGNDLLAKAVIHFYHNAWAASTARCYRTGQRRWEKFTATHPVIPMYPFPQKMLQEYELALAFYAAYLALQPTITRGSTVAAYLSHVRAGWRQAGCHKIYLSSEFVAYVTRGIHRALPAKPDSRQAFLLLACHLPRRFLHPPTAPSFLLKLATILGFFGMLRFNVIAKIKPASIILVAASGRQTLLLHEPVTDAHNMDSRFIGFYFRFRGKSNPIGDPPQAAYFPKLSDIGTSFIPFCPLHLLSQMHARGFFLKAHKKILPDAFKADDLCSYMMYLAGGGRISVNLALIKSHSLRIGGHTFFTAMGMAPDLTDYLGRRKVPRASLRYFRAHPSLTLTAIRCFFMSIPLPSTYSPKLLTAEPPPLFSGFAVQTTWGALSSAVETK